MKVIEYLCDYFPENTKMSLFVQNATAGTERKRKLGISFIGNLLYRTKFYIMTEECLSIFVYRLRIKTSYCILEKKDILSRGSVARHSKPSFLSPPPPCIVDDPLL